MTYYSIVLLAFLIILVVRLLRGLIRLGLFLVGIAVLVAMFSGGFFFF